MMNQETEVPKPAFGTFSHLVRLRVDHLGLSHVSEDMIQMAGIILGNKAGMLIAPSADLNPVQHGIHGVWAQVIAESIVSLVGVPLSEIVKAAYEPNPELGSMETLMGEVVEGLQKDPLSEELATDAQIGRFEALRDNPKPQS